MNTGSKLAACLAATAFLGGAASAQEIIYDNSVPPAGTLLNSRQGNAEIGDLVDFAGTQRTLSEFSLEYFINPSGNETMQVFLRRMDGPGGTPGSVIYDSGVLDTLGPNSIAPNGADFYTFRAQGLSLEVPEQVAFSVNFTGFESGLEGGLLFYGDEEVGTSPRFDAGSGTISEGPGAVDFYYRKGVAGWDIVTESDPAAIENFAARFTAVPEPSTYALLLGGLASFAMLRRRK